MVVAEKPPAGGRQSLFLLCIVRFANGRSRRGGSSRGGCNRGGSSRGGGSRGGSSRSRASSRRHRRRRLFQSNYGTFGLVFQNV